MSVRGFSVNGSTEQYDYNYLDNLPDDEVYWCDLLAPSYTDASAAFTGGKIVCMKYLNRVYIATNLDLQNAIMTFTSVQNGSVYVRTLDSNDQLVSSSFTIPTASSSTPSALGTAAAGSSTDYARGDHVHAMPTASDVGAIAAPSSPTSGQYLTWNGSAWVAASLPLYNGGVS